MATRITTLKDSTNTDALLPKTVLKAVADDNGNYLDQNLTASDLNSLKNGAFNTVVTHTNDLIGGALPINADQLNGHPDTYFMNNTFTDISSSVSLSSISGSIGTPTIIAYTNGRIITFQINFSLTANVSEGNNIFTATINGLPTRNIHYNFTSFYNTCITALLIRADDGVTCRALAGGLSNGNLISIGGVMIADANA